MQREPLDSVEYESTYLELRPVREQLIGSTEAPILARRPAAVHVHGRAFASDSAAADIGIEALGRSTTPGARPAVAVQAVSRSRARAVHPPTGPPTSPLKVTSRRCPGGPSGHLSSLRRPRSWTLLRFSLVAVGASVGIVADLDLRAARGLFISLTGILLLGWARLAWLERPRAEPFGATVTRALDRLVTALGTLFAIALWAKYAPHASAPISRTVVLVLSGLGLIGGLLAAARSLLP